jgi:hypothetical protein
MESNRGEAPANFELPPQPPSPEGEQRQEQAVEAPAARPETTGNRPQAPALPVIPDDIPAVDQPVIAVPPQDVTTPVVTDPKAVAEDTDRIEQEWVDKAKAIISRTHSDPFLQKDQMSKIKAEYIQKRFNKTIKTDEAAA